MELAQAARYAGSIIIAAILIPTAATFGGCAPKTAELMLRTKLPNPPKAATEPCQPLSEAEEKACMQQGPGARRVCGKVERTKAICDSSQRFIGQLYDERQDK